MDEPTYVCITFAYYDQPIWYARHYVPWYLSRRGKVLFVEKNPSLAAVARHYEDRARTVLRPVIRKEGEHLRVLRPVPRLPLDRRHAGIDRLNQRMLARQVRTAVAQTPADRIVIISFDYRVDALLDIVPHRRVVYYVSDDVLEYGLPQTDARVVGDAESRLLARADLTVVVSEQLAQRCAGRTRRVLELGHGVDLPRFASPGAVPEVLKRLPRPVIGFMGKLNPDPFDVDLVLELARAHRDMTFALVGPVMPGFPFSRMNEPNIVHCGTIDHTEVPAYLAGFDVCIIPYHRNAYTQAMNPIKVLEYLASGRPVVSTPVPAVGAFGDAVAIAEGAKAFGASIQSALSEPPENRQYRQRIAAEHSWERQVDSLVRELGP